MKTTLHRSFALLLAALFVFLGSLYGSTMFSSTHLSANASVSPSLPKTTAISAQTSPAQPEEEGQQWRIWDTLSPALQAKVDPRILAELRGQILPAHLLADPDVSALLPPVNQPRARTRFLVYLQKQPDLAQLKTMVFASHVAQRTALFHLLTETAQSEQAALRSFLDSQLQANSISAYQPLYIVNAIVVEGGLTALVDLAQRADVARIAANYPLVKLWGDTPTPVDDSMHDGPTTLDTDASVTSASLATLDPANWNIDLVDADRVWAQLKVRGEGAVVAGFDTGVSFRHPALVKQYRGNQGNGQFNHNYNWFEPDSKLYPNGNLGPSVSKQPRDCDGHGTHTMGTSVGDGGQIGTQVGMAPSAKWIAIPGICSNTMSGGIGDDIGGLKAFQWLLCPTDLSGDLATARCDLAPDAVNNSWGSANPVNDVLRPAIQALRAMGIAPVFASGNPDAGSGSIGTPANAPEAITVGATDEQDLVTYFSGRGPSFYEGEQKPELSAPGSHVNSSVGSGEYEYASGTSMAAPHVTGLIALMVSADLQDGVRDFSVDELEKFMMYSAVDLGKQGPDDDYGYGRINAFEAVRWVLSAGDLRGNVRDASSNLPIPDAKITGTGGNTNFQAIASANGIYSVTVPAGDYRVVVQAWGYVSQTFPAQRVFAGALSVTDFALTAQPKATLQGVIQSNGAPVANALVVVQAQPATFTRSGVDGAFTLVLPVGETELLVQAPGYRIARPIVHVEASGSTQTLLLESAPSILLVEANAYRGWFEGWPIRNIFRWALDKESYQYDFWPIQYLTITDTKTLEDGSLGYGIPSTTTLSSYDVVIWAHSGCDFGFSVCFYASSPTSIRADEKLRAYLDAGGRLILSGQDIGVWDDGTKFYDDYLHANRVLDAAARQGDTLSGLGILDSLHLTVTNASLYGYRNGAIELSPDAIAPEVNDGAAYPILTYDENGQAAALAVDPCNANYRAVYLGMGFENIGPRAMDRDPAIAAVLGRSIAWLNSPKQAENLTFFTTEPSLSLEPGAMGAYKVTLLNSGQTPLSVQLTLANQQWVTRIFSGTAEAPQPLLLTPCQSVDLRVEVTAPLDAHNGDKDPLTITAVGSGAVPARSLQLTTTAFTRWKAATGLLSSRYRLGAVALLDRYVYAVGGLINFDDIYDSFYVEQASAANERYDACTGRWESMAALPQPRANAATQLLDGKIYVMGGNTLSASFDYLEVKEYTEVFVYDPATNVWAMAAPLPQAVAGAATAVVNGKLYLFGGISVANGPSAKTYMYDPASNSWQEKRSMLNGGRYFMAAAAWGGKIYVAGGWPGLDTVEVYDPVTDAWTTAAPMLQARHSFNLVIGGAPGKEDYLYASGGGFGSGGLGESERYHPATNTWETVSTLTDTQRWGAASVYASGRIFTFGGSASHTTESLMVDTSFCLSSQTVARSVIGYGETITYTVNLYTDPVERPSFQYTSRLPTNTTFVGFVKNPVGATYNSDKRQIEWQGALAARATPKQFAYSVQLSSTDWHDGDLITSTAIFDGEPGGIFTRTIASRLLASDLSASQKQVDRATALSGDVMTYTIQLRGRVFGAHALTLQDPLPEAMTYIPDSLSYDAGQATYDASTHSIRWQNDASGMLASYFNFGDEYVWGDSDGDGEAPGAHYNWIDISATGHELGGGDYVYYCDQPIGFPFPFYNRVETRFCVSTNGFVSFDTEGNAADFDRCPLPTTASNEAMIAAIWDDLVIDDGIRYETLGTAPNRYLVVQWSGARRYLASNEKLAEFQLILHENGLIRIQIRDVGLLNGNASTTGIEDYTGLNGITYACNKANTLHSEQAIAFVAPGSSLDNASVDLRFRVRNQNGLGVNAHVTNTVRISTTAGLIERSAATLINPVSLAASAVSLNKTELVPNEVIDYRVAIRNTGLVTAANASLQAPLPAALTYVDGSVTCSSGNCTQTNNLVQWVGAIGPQQVVTVTFAARLTTPLPDHTAVTGNLEINDGHGGIRRFATAILARRSNLQPSQIQIVPSAVDPGETAEVAIYVQNAGGLGAKAEMEFMIPTGLIYEEGSLVCAVAACIQEAGVIRWHGEVAAHTVVTIHFRLKTPATGAYGELYTGSLLVKDLDWGESYSASATLWLAHTVYFPIGFAPEPYPRIYFPLLMRERAGEE